MKGKLKVIPGTMPPLTNPVAEHVGRNWAVTNVSFLEFKYYSDAEKCAELVPDIFELDEKPVCRVAFMLQGMSPLGPYYEVIFYIECKYKGVYYEYEPVLYVTQDASLVAGREPTGRGKVLSKIEFDPLKNRDSSIVTAVLSRPENVPLAYGLFKPFGYLGRVEDNPELGDPGLACVSIKTVSDADPKFYTCKIMIRSGDVWEGRGSLAYTGFSMLDDLHNMPVVEMIKSKLVINATCSFDENSWAGFSVKDEI